jgi:diguanylate cyclase (GGDEF)-like protein
LNVAVGLVLTLIMLGAMERILQTEAKARQKAEQLQLTLENMNQGIMLVTSDLQIPIINSRCSELLNLPQEFIKTPPRFDELIDYQRRHAPSREAPALIESRYAPALDDEERSKQVSISERIMPNGTVLEIRTGALTDGSFVQTFTDITKRRQAEDHVARLASEDSLTGLPNRRHFRSVLEGICTANAQHTRRAGSRFAVLFLDVDRFKVINDTLGHRIGDMLLQDVSERLRAVVQTQDTLARLGGDEFAIIVADFNSRTEIETLANAIVESIVRPYEIDGYQIRSSISIGIAVGPSDGRNVDELLMAADLALYAVKAECRGSFKFYHTSMNAELNNRRQIEMDLRQAIERRELELHYQPIINLAKKTVVGFEALARWRHQQRGLVPPSVFIPVAEESGLIISIGEWALREACRAASQWPEELRISVNLSPAQLLAPNMIDVVKNALSEAGLDPHRLEIEITERIFIEDTSATLRMLKRLKNLGIRIAMDDFGTGYSSLSYLRRFPFDKIKIDRTFVSDLATGTEHVAIVQAVVSIARALGMSTTAEGIEVAHQQEFLAALGCDEGQGYLFSPAVPLENVPAIIAEWNANKWLAA